MKTGFIQLGQLCLLLTLSFSFSACNTAEEYYAKEKLLTNIDGPGGEIGASNGGSDNGGTTDGASSGGATDGGSTGSTDGSSAGGSDGGSTGGVDGSTSGGSSGGSTGGVSGGTSGGTTGATAGGGTSGGNYTNASETFNQTMNQAKKLDTMWIIDSSGSMSDEQADLGTNFSAFIDDFITKDVDFRMGITTTDPSNSRKGVMVPHCDTKLNSAAAKANPEQFKHDFKNMVKVGINGSGNEQGLNAADWFMQRYSSSFIRSDAYLAVVIVSDEEDQSPKSVEEYANILKSYKTNAGLVKVYSVVDVNKTNYGSGIATGGDRYIAASDKTAGVAADIRDDFHGVLSDMGNSIINLLDSFTPANDPVPGSLKVYVNDVLSSAYTFDAASRSIKFNTGSVPAAGAVIKVTYLK